MKKTILVLTLLWSSLAFSQVGMGTDTPNSNAILDLTATDKALLLPRLANTNVIDTPVDGMLIYAVNPKCFKGYQDNTWVNLTTCEPIASAMTFGALTYDGVSVLNTTADKTGIGYNGENVPSASTITVEVTVAEPTVYSFSATDPGTGLTYSASGSFAAAGTFSVVLQNNGIFIPSDIFGVLTMPLTGASNSINLEPRIDIKSIPASATAVVDVISASGKTWMDRNLGADRAATALNDGLSFGNLYQWGRLSDGHEIIITNGANPTVRTGLNGTTTTLSATDTPNDNLFVVVNTGIIDDWRDPQNNSLWQGVSGINNPCPSGYRLPTDAEWNTEISTYNITQNSNAFTSPLKMSMGGYRWNASGANGVAGEFGYYWSSTVSGVGALYRFFENTNTYSWNSFRANAYSIRCIKN